MSETRAHPLSAAFMRGHPEQAAGVLETLPVDEAAALFTHVPARLGALVLAAMLPRRAARCIAVLDDPRALELLAAMPTQPLVALLRHVPEPRRGALIAGLPTAAALASTLLLGHPDDTLGAWADPDVLMLPADTRAGDAIERLREARAAYPLLFVADPHRRLAGIIELAALLGAPADASLGGLMQRPTAVLPASSPLADSAAHPAWEQTSALPVVEAGDRLVGVLTRDALARALHRVAPPVTDAAPGTLAGLAGSAYWNLLSGLFDAALALLPRVPAAAAMGAEADDAGGSDGR